MDDLAFRAEPVAFPCLYLDAEQWARLPERLADPFLRTLHESNLQCLASMRGHANAEAIFAASRSPLNDIARRTLKDYFQRSMVAWHLTHDAAHLDLARATLIAACRSHQWRMAPNAMDGLHAAGLETGELLHLVASGFDALHQELTPAEREECLDALIHKGLAAYLDGLAARDWWIECDFNWNSALHGNAGVAALAIRHVDRALSDRVLDAALRGLPHMIASFYPGGGYIEGLMYLCTAVGHLTDFVIPLSRFTGHDLGLKDNAAFAATIDFLVEWHGGDGRAYNFGDIHDSPHGAAMAHFLYWARVFNRPDWTADQRAKLEADAKRHRDYSGMSGLFRAIEALWLAEPGQPARPAPPRPPLLHFPGIDWLRWRGARTWLAFRSGFNGGNHDNDDLGHFILGIDRERFLVDPGYGAVKASQHNCVTIRRHEQTDCATARIVRLEELPNGFYLDCDLQPAFPHVLEYYHRHLLLIDDTHLLLLDDIRAHGRWRTDVRGHLQTRFPARRTDDGFAIEGKEHTLRIRFLSDVGALCVTSWAFNGAIQTLSWDDVYYRSHSVQPILLTFGDPAASYKLEPGRFEITLERGTARFEGTNDGPLVFRGLTVGSQAV